MQNQQDQKEAFLKGGSTETHNSGSLTLSASPYQVMAGTVIAGALVTGIKSDLPGGVNATVTEPVKDTDTGQYLLIPQGSRILGKYNRQLRAEPCAGGITRRDSLQDSLNQVGQRDDAAQSQHPTHLDGAAGPVGADHRQPRLGTAPVLSAVLQQRDFTMSTTRKLRLGPLPKTESTKLTFACPASLKADLARYAALYAQTYGELVDAVTLIPHMLEAFMAGERGFRKGSTFKTAPQAKLTMRVSAGDQPSNAQPEVARSSFWRKGADWVMMETQARRFLAIQHDQVRCGCLSRRSYVAPSPPGRSSAKQPEVELSPHSI